MKSLDENKFKVPRQVWKTWGVVQREVFNATYSIMTKHPGVFVHPNAAKVPAAHWNTTAWNAAWVAGQHAQEATTP